MSCAGVVRKRARRAALLTAALAGVAGCWSPEPPRPGGSFRFAVFGDGPYGNIETGRAERVFAELSSRPIEFVIHVGDIMWERCTDSAYRARRAFIEHIDRPVVYTPGDNEWSDCVDIPFSGDDPLTRLASLRTTFFADPARSLGAAPIALESQASDPEHAEFVEHARWSHGGVWFVTVHVVGGSNGGRPFAGRESRHDEEVARRTEAAVAWLYASFEAAVEAGAAAVVVAMHANPLFRPDERVRSAYSPLDEALVDLAQHFGKPVLVVHGDEHHYILDRPFRDPVTGEPVPNLQRLETFGSPDIGWVDVVVDPALPEVFRFEPNVTPRWMWW